MATLSRTAAAATGIVGIRPRWLILTLAGLGFLLVWGVPTIIIPLASDQVLFVLGARTVLDGGHLYQDFWEIKPPLIFLVYAMPIAVVGEHMEVVRVLDLVNTALAMGAVFLLSRQLFNERAAILAAAFYGFTYLTWMPVEDLGETESFMAAPLALAFFLYRPEGGHRNSGLRALAAGVLLGVAFAFKTTAVVFLLGLPAAELALRRQGDWTLRRALQRLALAGLGFVVVQGSMAGYLLATGVLDDFIEIQQRYTMPYNSFRWSPEGSHLRFLVRSTSDWATSMSFIVVPAAVAVFFAYYRRQQAGAIWLMALLGALGLLAIWWQGKMYHYHWLTMVPLLAPLAGYALDQLAGLFAALSRREAWTAYALVACLFLVLAADQLQGTYDRYRTLIGFADGSLSRREVEARYYQLFPQVHEVVDYVRVNGGADDSLFVWGFWPVAYFWAERPLVSRFVENHGLRATWTPASWQRELMDDLETTPPRFLAVARGDRQPWLVGTSQTSDEYLRDSFPELRRFLDQHYILVRDVELFALYERLPSEPRVARAVAR